MERKFASLVILKKEGRILLIRRANTGYKDGEYSLPAGKVEKDETFTNAVIREAKEEVNAHILASNLKSVHIMHRKSIHNVWVDNFFLCQKWSGEIKNMEPNKCDDLQWFDINNLPENTIDFVKHALKQIFQHKCHYSEYNWKKEE